MEEKIKNYLRKLLKYGTNLKKDDTLIVILPEMDKLVIQGFKNLQKEFNLKDIIFKDKNYKRIYHLLKNINIDDINKYIHHIDITSDIDNTKFIIFEDNSLAWYENMLLYSEELEEKYDKYLYIDKKINHKFYELYSSCFLTLSVFPTSEWSLLQYGSKNNKKKLWGDLVKLIPSTDKKIKTELEKLIYIKNYLNDLKIKELYFNTKIGTDFKVELSNYSKWVNNFDNDFIKEYGYVFNFPSYEIYTSPNMKSADGKVVFTKPSSILGIEVTSGEIELKKGKVISINSDNSSWEKIILLEDNKMNMLGEIALVSSDNPIAKSNKIFNNLLLDENAGCHLALGSSLNECNYLINKFDKEQFGFNSSDYHQDITFGDNSTYVECKTFEGKKRVLINEGKWQI